MLLVGGETMTDSLFPDGFDAISCAEIFDPETSQFTPLSDCDESTSSGDLTLPTAFPSIASDPTHGALVVGGMDDKSTAEVVLFTIPPSD